MFSEFSQKQVLRNLETREWVSKMGERARVSLVTGERGREGQQDQDKTDILRATQGAE